MNFYFLLEIVSILHRQCNKKIEYTESNNADGEERPGPKLKLVDYMRLATDEFLTQVIV